MRRRKDLGLYKLVEKNGKTVYEYRGDAYVPPIPAQRLPRVKALLFLGCLLQAALAFLMGRLDFPSFRKLYVIIPFLAVIFGAGKCLLSSAALFTWKTQMTLRQHQLSWSQLTLGSLISLVSSALLLIAALVYLVLQGGRIAIEWPLALLCAAYILLSVAFFTYLKARPCQIKASGLLQPEEMSHGTT